MRTYLQYTKMVGELAARYMWQSMLPFDEEYRQQQAKQGFPWWTDAPHLGTVMLRDHGPQLTPQQKKAAMGQCQLQPPHQAVRGRNCASSSTVGPVTTVLVAVTRAVTIRPR